MHSGLGLEHCTVMTDERTGDLVKCKNWKSVTIIVTYVNPALWFQPSSKW